MYNYTHEYLYGRNLGQGVNDEVPYFLLLWPITTTALVIDIRLARFGKQKLTFIISAVVGIRPLKTPASMAERIS